MRANIQDNYQTKRYKKCPSPSRRLCELRGRNLLTTMTDGRKASEGTTRPTMMTVTTTAMTETGERQTSTSSTDGSRRGLPFLLLPSCARWVRADRAGSPSPRRILGSDGFWGHWRIIIYLSNCKFGVIVDVSLHKLKYFYYLTGNQYCSSKMIAMTRMTSAISFNITLTNSVTIPTGK